MNEYKTQIAALNEEIFNINKSKNMPKEDLPVNLNESIITELKTELYAKKVFKIL